MAKLRKGVAYRKLERPYTRKSKYRKQNFVRANPHNLIVKYEMGSPRKYPVVLHLIVDEDVQLRHNAVEAGRKSANKLLETKLQRNFFLKFRLFPHHVLRENPLASGAGADRMSTGMKMSFGKPIGVAAQCKKGKVIAELHLEEKDLATGVLALKRMQYKIPVHCLIERVVEKKPKRAPIKPSPKVAPPAAPKKEPEPQKPTVTKEQAEAKEILAGLDKAKGNLTTTS